MYTPYADAVRMFLLINGKIEIISFVIMFRSLPTLVVNFEI
jgi:hypothetical protein